MWNHRVIAHENGIEVYFMIHEVQYDDKKQPISHTVDPISVGGESVEDIEWVLEEMAKSLKKPILSLTNFPQEYER